jgi:hypothetical protein
VLTIGLHRIAPQVKPLLRPGTKEIPMGRQRKIVDAKADSEGDITHVLFEGNERFTSVERAIPMADRGEIANTHVVRRAGAKTHLRTDADGRKRNNLDDMAGDT